jgi:fructoselysine 3-epimerase
MTAEAGYDGLDIWGGRPHAYRRDLSARELHELRALLDDCHLAVASFIPAQFRYPTSLCAASDRIRRDSIAYIREGMESAVALGAPLVSVCPGHTLHCQTQADGWSRLADSLCQISETAGTLGLQVALEPADRYETDLVQTTGQALAIVREVGHPALGVVLDVGHALVVGESATEAVRNLGPYLFHVHVDDNQGLRDQHLVPGEGNFAFPSFVAALAAAGYEGFLCAELSWSYTVDPEPAVHKTLSALRSWLAEE